MQATVKLTNHTTKSLPYFNYLRIYTDTIHTEQITEDNIEKIKSKAEDIAKNHPLFHESRLKSKMQWKQESPDTHVYRYRGKPNMGSISQVSQIELTVQ